MRTRSAGLAHVAAIVFALALLPRTSVGATYTFNEAGNPASLVCGYYATEEICGQGVGIDNISLQNGDSVVINVNYQTTLNVPASATSTGAFIVIGDQYQRPGPALPGNLGANVTSTATGFATTSTAQPYSTYVMPGILNEYAAAITYCCGGPGLPSPGFSLDTMSSTITVTAADTNPMVFVDWGYTTTLAAPPQSLVEVGGTPDHPLILSNGIVGQISSSIASGGSDFYGFNWKQDGVFQVNAKVTDTSPTDILALELLNPYTHQVISGDDLSLNSADNFDATLSIADLPAGAYEVGIQNLDQLDPNFTLTFNTPIGAVPEPASWALMLVGIGGVGAALRSRSRRAPSLRLGNVS